MSTTAPFGYKKDGTPRTRRAPGTGLRYKGPLKNPSTSRTQAPSKPQVAPPPAIACPIPGCTLDFSTTKDPRNSLLVHVRYKSKKGSVEHQLELEKMIKARKTDRMYWINIFQKLVKTNQPS